MTARVTPQSQISRWAVALMFMANGFVMGVWATQIPLLLPRHDITKPVVGLLILGLGIGAVSAMLFSGKLLARFGSRTMTRGFALALVPVLPMVVFAPSLPTVAIAMALMGAVAGSMDVGMNANAVAVERTQGRAIMSSSHGFWSLGGFFGGLGGGPVIAAYGAEMQSLIAAGIVLVLVAIAWPFLVEEPRAVIAPAGLPRKDVQAASPPLLPRHLGIWVLGILSFLSMVPEGAVLDWSALYLLNEHGATVSQSGLAFGLFSGAMAVLRFIGDAVRNRFGAVRTLRVSALIGSGGMFLAAIAPTPELATAGFFLSGIGVANLIPIIFSAAGNFPGVAAGTAISTVTMLGYSGILVAPSAIGFVAQQVGFRPTYIGLAMLMLVVAAMAGRAAMADGIRKHDGH